MSVGAMVAAARTRLLNNLLGSRCEIYTGASGWVTRSVASCQLEQATPASGTGQALDYELGNGYGYTVWVARSSALATGDRITVDGMTLEVQRVGQAGTNEPLVRAECVRR